MRAEAIKFIKRYLYDLNKYRYPFWACKFEENSYAKWAVRELLREILCNEKTPPMIIVERFADRMDRYAVINTEVGRGFSVAHDTALDILDKLL